MSAFYYDQRGLRTQEQKRADKLKDGRYKTEGRNKACRRCTHVKAKHPRGGSCSCRTCDCRRFVPL